MLLLPRVQEGDAPVKIRILHPRVATLLRGMHLLPDNPEFTKADKDRNSLLIFEGKRANRTIAVEIFGPPGRSDLWRALRDNPQIGCQVVGTPAKSTVVEVEMSQRISVAVRITTKRVTMTKPPAQPAYRVRLHTLSEACGDRTQVLPIGRAMRQEGLYPPQRAVKQDGAIKLKARVPALKIVGRGVESRDTAPVSFSEPIFIVGFTTGCIGEQHLLPRPLWCCKRAEPGTIPASNR